MLTAILWLTLSFAGVSSPPLAESVIDLDVNKSTVLENRTGVKRVATATPEIAEAVVVSVNEVMVNGKAPGETSLVLWDGAGVRTIFNVRVHGNDNRADMVRDELAREFPGSDITFRAENGAVFLSGTAPDTIAADRAVAIATTLGKVVNLLRVPLPPAEPQILLHVRFANVDRSASTQLGLNFFSTGAGNTPGSISTGQTSPPGVSGPPTTFSVQDALNIFFYRPDLNLGGTLAALVSKNLAEILAEPNLLTISGRPASFLAGGEFPFPTLQGGGGGVGQVTIQFHEFGIRLHFLPFVTPRGTIRMTVTPEVSSLDYANGLTVDGFTVPGLDTRRVETEIELRNGQSFVIAGLLDNRLSQTIDKIPGLGDIPLVGKLFQSKVATRSHTELLVIVTPEIVRPIEPGEKAPDIPMPVAFLKGSLTAAPQSPAASPSQISIPDLQSIPVEVLHDSAPAPPQAAPPQPPQATGPVSTAPVASATPPASPAATSALH
jgi:pilus assembly protein CpaC